MQRSARWGALLLILPLLLIGAGYLVLATEAGTRWLVQAAEDHWSELELEQPSGSLISGLHIDRLAWRGGDLELEARGAHLDWRPGCLWSGRICIDALEVDALQGVSVAGEPGPIVLPEPSLPVDVSLARLQVRELGWQVRQVDGSAGSVVSVQDIHLAASMEGELVEVQELRLLEGGRSWQGSGTLNIRPGGSLDVRIRGDLGELDVPGIAASGPLTLALNLGGDWERTTVAGVFSGPVEMHADGAVSPLYPELPMQLQLTTRETIQWKGDGLDVHIAEPRVDVTGDLKRFRFKLNTHLAASSYPAGTLMLSGEGRGDGSVEIGSLRFATDQKQGELHWDGALGWKDAKLTWDGEIETRGLNLQVIQPRLAGSLDARLQTRGDWQADRWALHTRILQASGNVQDHPLRMGGALDAQSNGTLRIQNGLLSSGMSSFKLSGNCVPECALLAQMDVPELDALLLGVSGRVQGEARMTGQLSRLNLDVSLQGNEFALDDYSVPSWSATALIAELGEKPGRFRIDASDIGLPGEPGGDPRKISALSLEGHASLKSVEATLEVESAEGRLRSVLSAAPRVDSKGDWAGQLGTLDVASPVAGEWRLQGATEWQWQGGVQQVVIPEGSCLGGDRGRICLHSGARLGQKGALEFSLEGLATASWQSLFPPDFSWEDSFSGNGSAQWEPNVGPRVQLLLEGGPGRFSLLGLPDEEGETKAQHLAYTTLRWEAQLDAQRSETRLTLDSGQLGSVDFRLALPRDRESLSGQIKVAGLDLQVLRPWLAGVDRVEGRLDAEIAIAGTSASPDLDGEMILAGGVLSGAGLPLEMRGLDLKAQLSGKRAEIAGQFNTGEVAPGSKFETGKDGWVSVNGNVRWEESPWQVSLGMMGRGLVMQSGSHTRATLDASLGLGVEPEALQARGRIAVREGRIRLPKRVGGTVEHSADVVLDPPDPQQPAKRKSNWKIDSQLALELGKNLHFSGLGLDGWLEGGLELRSLHAEPEAHGRITVQKGRYRAYGQRLEIRKGELLFTGNLRVPALEIEAIRPLPDVVAGIRVTGDGEEPIVSLFSEPAMPEEDVLSWVVLGRPIGESSGQDGSLLASSALLLGLRGGEELTGKVAERLGITQFEVGTVGQSGSTDVFASGYLSPDLFLRYQTGTDNPAHALMLRYRLLSKLYLEATSGLENAIDLLYTMEF